MEHGKHLGGAFYSGSLDHQGNLGPRGGVCQDSLPRHVDREPSKKYAGGGSCRGLKMDPNTPIHAQVRFRYGKMCLGLTFTESHREKPAMAFFLSGCFYLLVDNMAVNTLFTVLFLFLFYFNLVMKNARSFETRVNLTVSRDECSEWYAVSINQEQNGAIESGGFHSRNNSHQEWHVSRGCVPVAQPPRRVTGGRT